MTPVKKRTALLKWVISIIIVLLLISTVGVFMYFNTLTSKLTSYSVNQGNPNYTISFYPNSKPLAAKGNNYLVYTDNAGKMTEMWLTNISGPQGYGSYSTFTYDLNGSSQTGAYTSAKNIYVSDIQVEGHYYQLNITSQSSVSVNDAKAIFGSLELSK